MGHVIDDNGLESPSLSLLMEDQIKRLKNGKSQWHPLILKWALTIWDKGGGAAYSALRESGFISLPSESTLKRMTRGSQQHVGIVPDHIRRIKESADNFGLKEHEREVVLMFDEIHIQAGLRWKLHTSEDGEVVRELVGFGDETDAKLAPDDTAGTGALSRVILQYMVRSVCGKWCKAVAFYAFRVSSHIRLHETFWEVMGVLHGIGLRVHMVGCCHVIIMPRHPLVLVVYPL